MLVGIRSLPVNGDVPGAIARIKTVKVYPLKPTPGWPENKWLDLTPIAQDTTPVAWEMEKGKPFNPDARMTGILEQAARTGNAQMRVESFGDRRPDRIVWPERKREWAALRFEDGDSNATHYGDLYARDKWFYQAFGVSPAMFKRDPTAGSLYWLGLRDNTGATLDGGRTYELVVPQQPCTTRTLAAKSPPTRAKRLYARCLNSRMNPKARQLSLTSALVLQPAKKANG